MKYANNITELIGNTPLVKLQARKLSHLRNDFGKKSNRE